MAVLLPAEMLAVVLRRVAELPVVVRLPIYVLPPVRAGVVMATVVAVVAQVVAAVIAVVAHILASLSSGSPGRALEYKESGVFDKRDELIKGLVERKFFELGFFDDADREELKLYLELMLTWYRDILVAKAGADKAVGLVNIDRRDIIFNEAGEMDFDKIDDIITRIISSGRSLDRNANLKLTMSVLGASIC